MLVLLFKYLIFIVNIIIYKKISKTLAIYVFKRKNVDIQDRVHGQNQKSFLYVTVDIIKSTHKFQEYGNKSYY